jgi:glycosyltransferase involved in cell wall biosynthesis
MSAPLTWRAQPLRWFAFRCLDAIARAAAWMLLLAFGRHVPPPAGRSAGGPLVVLLPVLPDLSHTFVYREVLALLAQRPDARVLCLERNTSAPVHAEAQALLARTGFVPQQGILAHYATVLGTMLREPRRTAGLLALYRHRPGGTAGDLLGKNPLRDPRHPGRAFALAHALAAQRPGHLHVYGSTYAANVAMGAALLLERPFSISSYVDFDFAYDFKMLADKHARASFFRVCTRFCQRRILDLLPGATAERTPAIVWGLDLALWPPRWQPARAGRLFTACRLVPKKGLHLVPPALARLRESGVGFEWRVAGSGPELARLERLIAEHALQDRVRLLGPLPNDRVRAELEQADLFLLPCVIAPDGDRDGIPIAITEAMATGVPVLTTPVSGIPEVVRDGDTGFLVPPGDPIALANRLRELLANPERCREAAARGRREVETTHAVDDSARALLRCIEGSSA